MITPWLHYFKMSQTEQAISEVVSSSTKSNGTKGMNCNTSHVIKKSIMARNTINPIRKLVDQMKLSPNPEKSMIPLSIGDPTTFGNLVCDDMVIEAVIESLRNKKCNGYLPTTGQESAKEAVAKYSSCSNYNLTSEDIIITSGCSGALEHSILVLANPGQNILIPRPGFSLYKTLCASSGIIPKFYNLLSESQWEVDLADLENQIDNDTVAIIVNNPGNPCGSVYTKEHLMEILDVAERYGLPVIADEIYHFFTFCGAKFEYMASLNDRVPILGCSGLSKRFLCPGWRIGWIAIYDKYNRFEEIRMGLNDLATRTMGGNSIVQDALPKILANVKEEHFEKTINLLEENTKIIDSIFSETPGLRLVKPQGAMFAMVEVKIKHFKSFSSNEEFIINMVAEESVFCLPSEVFDIQNYFRILLTIPSELMTVACQRIKSYCCRHFSEV